MRLQGKRALVTAAGAGIGRATALALAKAGADVLATDIDAAALEALSSEAKLTTRVLDVRDEAAIAGVASAHARWDILVNCAGMVHDGDVLQASMDDFTRAYDLNVLSMIRMIRAVLPGMRDAGAGSIVNIASVASSITGVPNRCAYGVTKAAVIGLTKSVASDFVGRQVRCNAICPGTIDTPSLRGRAAAQGDEATGMAAFVARQPIGRLGKPEEVAAMAEYLASDDAAFVTGQIFVIDGGWTT